MVENPVRNLLVPPRSWRRETFWTLLSTLSTDNSAWKHILAADRSEKVSILCLYAYMLGIRVKEIYIT